MRTRISVGTKREDELKRGEERAAAGRLCAHARGRWFGSRRCSGRGGKAAPAPLPALGSSAGARSRATGKLLRGLRGRADNDGSRAAFSRSCAAAPHRAVIASPERGSTARCPAAGPKPQSHWAAENRLRAAGAVDVFFFFFLSLLPSFPLSPHAK